MVPAKSRRANPSDASPGKVSTPNLVIVFTRGIKSPREVLAEYSKSERVNLCFLNPSANSDQSENVWLPFFCGLKEKKKRTTTHTTPSATNLPKGAQVQRPKRSSVAIAILAAQVENACKGKRRPLSRSGRLPEVSLRLSSSVATMFSMSFMVRCRRRA